MLAAALGLAACGGDGTEDLSACEQWETHREAVLDGDLSRQEIVEEAGEILDAASGDGVPLELRLSAEVLVESVQEGGDAERGYQAMQDACS